jgi:hypothetical protein
MVEISQRISMTSRAAARFSTMEDMLGSLGVWGGFCLRAILVGKRILSGIDAVSRGRILCGIDPLVEWGFEQSF